MDEAEADVLAFMTFPKDHRPKIHCVNPFERIKMPNEDAITRFVGVLPREQNDQRAVQRGRYISLETIAALSNDPIIKLRCGSGLIDPAPPMITTA
jgi:putative transposase